jgi:mono/diheme cytochrome c family protein
LTLKVRRRPGRLARWGGIAGLGFVVLLAGLVTVLEATGIYQVYAPRGNPVREVTVAITPELIAHGATIANAICSACHSLDGTLPLSGGDDIFADVPFPLGKGTPPNLTPVGRIADWSDGEIQRAIREGTNPDGHLMLVMATQNFRVFSQEDLDALVAYLRSQPPTTTEINQESSLTPLAMAMTALGMLPVKDVPDPEPPPPVEIGPTAEYGAYIAGFFDCALCHGDTYKGGTNKLAPVGPSLAGVKAWERDGFATAMRIGVTPFGEELSEDMPWEYIGRIDDEALTALYEFVKAIP